jgi:hypothetical protein
MQNVLKYIMRSFVNALLIFFVTHTIYTLFSEANILIATLANIALIFFVLVQEKIELSLLKKAHDKYLVKSRGRIASLALTLYRSWTEDASIKAGLYCFYIVLLLCTAIVSAKPEFPLLREHINYFNSVRYGLLILLASDKFMSQVFNDLKMRGHE